MADLLLVIQARAMKGASLGAWHDWLCHPNGEECPDGCEVSADRERLDAMIKANGIEPDACPSQERQTIPSGYCPRSDAPTWREQLEDCARTRDYPSIFDTY